MDNERKWTTEEKMIGRCEQKNDNYKSYFMQSSSGKTVRWSKQVSMAKEIKLET